MNNISNKIFSIDFNLSLQQSNLKYIQLELYSRQETLTSFFDLLSAFPISITIIQLKFNPLKFHRIMNKKYQSKWSELDTILSSSKYQSLKCFTLWINIELSDSQRIIQIFHNFFPKLIKKKKFWCGNLYTSFGMYINYYYCYNKN